MFFSVFMKKKIGVILFFALPFYSSANDGLKVDISGRIDMQVASVKQNKDLRRILDAEQKYYSVAEKGIVTDAAIEMRIDKKHNRDLGYGGYISLHADSSVATNGEDTLLDKSMIYLQDDRIGRFELGITPSAGGLFEMDTVNLSRGAYGIEGFWSQWIVQTTHRTNAVFEDIFTLKSKGFEFIQSPNLFSNYSGHYYSDAPKVNFFTKPLSELTLGITFIPDLDSSGAISGIASKDIGPRDAGRALNPRTVRDVINGGFMYETSAKSDFGFKLGAAGEVGKAKDARYKDLKAFESGLMLRYKDVKIGTTYGSWFDTLSLKKKISGTKQSSYYYTVGLSHQVDKKVGYSIGYMKSARSGGLEAIGSLSDPMYAALIEPMVEQGIFSDKTSNIFKNISIDIDYKLTEGLTYYVGMSKFMFKESNGGKDNGHVVLSGVRLLF